MANESKSSIKIDVFNIQQTTQQQQQWSTGKSLPATLSKEKQSLTTQNKMNWLVTWENVRKCEKWFMRPKELS